MVAGTMAYFDNDAGFTETFNQSARLYGTVLRNNFFTRLPRRGKPGHCAQS